MSMNLRAAIAFSLSAWSCVTSSTTADFETVTAEARQRAGIAPIDRDAETYDEEDPEAARLLDAPLTMETAVRIALLNNRDLRAEYRQLGIARGQLLEASLLPNPEFDLAVRFPQESDARAEWEVNAGIDLKDLILATPRAQVANARLDGARYAVLAATLDLVYQVRLAFIAVQAAQQDLELQQTALTAFTASYDAARAIHEAGNITNLDLVIQQAAYEEGRVAVAESEIAERTARERLNVLLGTFGDQTGWSIEERLQDARALDSFSELENRAVESSIELAHAKALLSADSRRTGLSQASGWLPDLTVGVSAERNEAGWSVGPAVSGRLPLFGRQQGDTLSARAELDAGRERYVAMAVAVRSAARSAHDRLASAQARALHYKAVILPVRERVVNETVLQYNAMQVGIFQLIEARRDQIAAAQAHIDTLHEYWAARAAVDQILAGRATGTLESMRLPSRPRGSSSSSLEAH